MTCVGCFPQVVIGPGDVLFVPGGTPHFVENLDATISYAGNFVDEGNVDAVLDDLKTMGLVDPSIRQAHDDIAKVDFDVDAGMHAELLHPQELVVPYHDYANGSAATWPAHPPVACAFSATANDNAEQPHGVVDPTHLLVTVSADTENLLEDLDSNGFVTLSQALSPSEIAALHQHLSAEMAAKIAHECRPPGDPESVFAKINTREHRHDLRLCLDGYDEGRVHWADKQ